MLSIEQAHKIAQRSSKYEHSIIVSRIMKALADSWKQDSLLWELTGILHDIDWDKTTEIKEKHGIMASEYLEGKLPKDGLHAIMSHDHRTGIAPISKLDKALIFSDALAYIFDSMNNKQDFRYSSFANALQTVTKLGRPWMKKIIEEYLQENHLTPKMIEFLWIKALAISKIKGA